MYRLGGRSLPWTLWRITSQIRCIWYNFKPMSGIYAFTIYRIKYALTCSKAFDKSTSEAAMGVCCPVMLVLRGLHVVVLWINSCQLARDTYTRMLPSWPQQQWCHQQAYHIYWICPMAWNNQPSALFLLWGSRPLPARVQLASLLKSSLLVYLRLGSYLQGRASTRSEDSVKTRGWIFLCQVAYEESPVSGEIEWSARARLFGIPVKWAPSPE